jgi:hypothetical protein
MTRVVGALDAAPGRGSSPECPRESGEAKGGSWPALSCEEARRGGGSRGSWARRRRLRRAACSCSAPATARALGGTQRSSTSRLTWTLPKFTRGVTEAATSAPGTARAISEPGTARAISVPLAWTRASRRPVRRGWSRPVRRPVVSVVGGLLSVVPIRRASSKRWTTHKLSLRRRAALSAPWRAHNGAWRACPPLLLLLPTTARPCPCDASVELLVLPLPPPLAAP